MKKFLTSFLVLLFSFAICFSSIDNSYAIQESYYRTSLPTNYKIKSDARVYDEGIMLEKYYLGTLKKGESVSIKAFERNRTGSWWCKISSCKNKKLNEKFKDQWIYAGKIDFPYKNKIGVVYLVSGDYASIPVYQYSSYKLTKTKYNIPRFYRIEFDQFSTSGKWGRIYRNSGKRSFKGKWVNMDQMNFCGFYRANKVATIRSGPSVNAQPVGTTQVNKVYPVKRIELNQAGNWWCKLDTIKIYPNESYGYKKYIGKWIYLPHLTAY